MQYDDALRLLPVESADSSEFKFTCPNCLGTATCYRGLDDEAVLSCLGECKEEEIIGKEVVDEKPALEANGVGVSSNLFQWKMMLYELGKRGLDDSIKAKPETLEAIRAAPLEGFVEQVRRLRNYPGQPLALDPSISPDEIETGINEIAVALQKHYQPATAEPERALSIVVEDRDAALALNEEYLSRPEIIERLGYAQSILLMIGGKHHGKTTNIRTLALSVMRELPIWKRKTHGGHVIYAASDDEVVSTRNELLKMGWNQKHDPLSFVRVDPESDATPEQVLDDIADLAVRKQAVLIILDMLFDFVGIKDELSYAGTRGPIRMVQKLADRTKCLVVGSHHTPKYLTDAHKAENAALGSQGISARFSPIIFTRKWTDTLFTVESTTVRDPRGVELKPLKIIKNDQGWIEPAGEFKEWMKWEIYAQRVLDLFDSPQRGFTVYSIAEKLGLDRARAQNTVKELAESGRLKREKNGRTYMYYLESSDMFQRENGIWQGDSSDIE